MRIGTSTVRSAEQMRLLSQQPSINLTCKEGHSNANLNDEFIRIDGLDVYKTPSTNLAVAANELTWLPQTPKVAKVAAMLKAAHYQVNEIHQDQRPSYSTTSIRRSAATRSDRRPSRFTNQHRNDRQPL